MAKIIQSKGTKGAIVMTSLEVFYRSMRRTGSSRVTEGARVSESTFYEGSQSKEALLRAFLEDRNAIWLRWFQTEINARYETTRGGLEIIADVLRKWFENPKLCRSAIVNVDVSNRNVSAQAFEVVRNQKHQLRRFFERLAVKMGIQYPDIAACAAVQIVERTIVATLRSSDLSELKTAQLLFQCLQHAVSVGFNQTPLIIPNS
ncbi:MAG TPA: hypothetical protein VGI45_22055 [Terracidiphilus sp.]|jgi:AcrR family transcriptional regulator